MGTQSLFSPIQYVPLYSTHLCKEALRKRDSKDAIFWYMMTSGSHTQHVWAVLQYPADPQKGLPVRHLAPCSFCFGLRV